MAGALESRRLHCKLRGLWLGTMIIFLYTQVSWHGWHAGKSRSETEMGVYQCRRSSESRWSRNGVTRTKTCNPRPIELATEVIYFYIDICGEVIGGECCQSNFRGTCMN